jgi:hypothetical protein
LIISILTKMTQGQAFAWFDDLAPVLPCELSGIWRGEEILTGHPMDGMLSAADWFGKFFRNPQDVDPLLFSKNNGATFSGNPGLLPLETFMLLPRPLIKTLFSIVSPFLHTKKGRARLYLREYRGKYTTIMQYDQKPIIDVFARISNDKILGLCDVEWVAEMGYFFTLTKE